MHLPEQIADDLFEHVRQEMDHYIRNDNMADQRQCNFCYNSYFIQPYMNRNHLARQYIVHADDCLGTRLLKLYEEEADK